MQYEITFLWPILEGERRAAQSPLLVLSEWCDKRASVQELGLAIKCYRHYRLKGCFRVCQLRNDFSQCVLSLICFDPRYRCDLHLLLTISHGVWSMSLASMESGWFYQMLPAIVCISSHVSRSLLNTLVQSYLRGLLPTLAPFISLIVLVSRFLLYFLNSAQDNTTPSAIEHKSRLRYFLFIKALAVVGLVTVNVTAFALEAYGSRQNLWTLAELITWLYVLVLAILQVVLSASCRRTLGLWNHLTAIYAV
jgi:hypothetical protein